jgi:putative membrane protein
MTKIGRQLRRAPSCSVQSGCSRHYLFAAPLWILPLILAQPALAHNAGAADSFSTWTFDPWMLLPLFSLSLLYVLGRIRLKTRLRRAPRPQWPLWAFAAGIFALAGALISPLHWLGERSFAFHMVEHEIVMAVAAPLVVLSRPVGSLLWGLPVPARKGIGSLMKADIAQHLWNWLTGAIAATIIHAIAIWSWHIPFLFDAAVTHIAVHRLQHLSFFLAAVLFWWAILVKSDYGPGAWHLFLTMLHTSVLGALMTLAPRVLYITQADRIPISHLTPLEDQQLAGLIMWIPGGAIYAAGAIAMLALWIRRADQRHFGNV